MVAPDRLPAGKYRLRVNDDEQLAGIGTFGDLKTELIDGDVVVMSPQFRPPSMAKTELYDALRAALLATASPLRPMVESCLARSDTTQP